MRTMHPKHSHHEPPELTAPTHEEDDHVRLFDWIARSGRPLSVVQPDPGGDPRAVVLVVDGGIVASLTVDSLFHPDSPRARGIMAQASANYRRFGRPEPFRVAEAAPERVAEQPADRDDAEFATAFEPEPPSVAPVVEGVSAVPAAPAGEDEPAFTRKLDKVIGATPHKIDAEGNAMEMGWGQK